MSKEATPVQIFECPVCGFRLETYVRSLEAVCHTRHPDAKKRNRVTPLKVVFDRSTSLKG